MFQRTLKFGQLNNDNDLRYGEVTEAPANRPSGKSTSPDILLCTAIVKSVSRTNRARKKVSYNRM